MNKKSLIISGFLAILVIIGAGVLIYRNTQKSAEQKQLAVEEKTEDVKIEEKKPEGKVEEEKVKEEAEEESVTPTPTEKVTQQPKEVTEQPKKVTPPPIPAITYTIYSNPLFLIKYPSQWIVDASDSEIVVFYSPGKEKDPDISFSVGINPNKEQQTPEEYGDDAMEVLSRGYQNFVFTKKRSLIIGGGTGVTYEYSGNLDNESKTVFMSVTSKNNRLYLFNFGGETSLYNENREKIEIIIDSFIIR